jgi:hypothetical protein
MVESLRAEHIGVDDAMALLTEFSWIHARTAKPPVVLAHREERREV